MPVQRSFCLVLWVLCCLKFTIALSQSDEFPIRIFTKESGLRYDFDALIQDNQDFIWIMYRDGIQRFDGVNMQSFLKGAKCHSLIKDTKGNIWVSRGSTIYRFDTKGQEFEEIKVEMGAKDVKILLEPYDNTIKYLSKSGIFCFDPINKSFLKSKNKTERTAPTIKMRREYISNYNHILFYKVGDSICRHNLKTGAKSYERYFEIRAVFAQSEETYIVSNWESKTWLYNNIQKTKHRLFLDENEPSLIVFDAIPISDRTSYLATSKGLLKYSFNDYKLEPLQLSLTGTRFKMQRFNVVYKADDGAIWSCNENSLLKFNNNESNFYFMDGENEDPKQRFTSDARSFVRDDSGNLWLATHNGLIKWDRKNNSFSTIYADENSNNKLNHPSIRGLVFDGTHLIIGQTNKGIWLYNPHTAIFKRPVFDNSVSGKALRKKVEQDFVNEINTLKNGHHLVSSRDGAYFIDGNTYRIKEVDFPGKNLNVKFSYEDSSGNIFIGTMGGLFLLDRDLNCKYEIKKGSESLQASVLLEYKDNFYIGTLKGVYLLTKTGKDTIVHSIIPELKDQWIRTIFSDNLSRLWLVTESDVHRYDLKTKTINTFGFTENVLGDFFYRNSYYRDEKGLVYLGGTNGINYFYPEKISLASKPLFPYIRSIQVPKMDSVLPGVSAPKLNYNNNNLLVEISTPYFGNRKYLNYRYQLKEGTQWFHLGNGDNVNLRGIPPGDYDLRISASLDTKSWYSSKESFRFTIRPPLWKRSWFIIGTLLFIAFALFRFSTSFKRKLKTERLLNGFATSLYGQSTVEGILWDTARYCVQELDFVDCIIYLIDRKRNILVQKAAFGIKNPYGKEIINQLEIPLSKGIVGSVARSGEAELISNTNRDSRYILDSEKALSEITVPIMVDGKVFAILDSEHPKRNFYKRYHLRLLKSIANICSHRLTKYLSEENLRREIARDLHDEMGSTLTSIHIISKIAEQDVNGDARIKKHFNQINRHTSGMMDKMSDMVWVINPANDSFDKLIYRIREYAVEILELAGIEILWEDLKIAEEIKINAAQRKNIYLIAKEAINNSFKHSEATKVKVSFKKEKEHLVMCIKDNGKGFDTGTECKGNGLRNLRSRANEIKATLILNSSNSHGVSICLKIDINTLYIINP